MMNSVRRSTVIHHEFSLASIPYKEYSGQNGPRENVAVGPFLQFRVWLRDTPGIELRAWTALGVVLCLLGIWAFAPEHDHGPSADRVEGAVAAGASRGGGGGPTRTGGRRGGEEGRARGGPG